MRKLLASVLAIIITMCALADNVQKGYVKTRGRLASSGAVIPGKRLPSATVVLQQGSAVVSDGAGNFSLRLPAARFFLKNVKKSGYVVSDPDILSRQYACTSNPLVLVLDEPNAMLDDKLASERKQRRLLQRRLQQKEDEIETLKEQNKITEDQYRQQLQKLYDDAESNEKFISEMAERYSRLDFDQLDDFQRQMAALIQDGELARADSLLRTKGSMDDREAEINRLREANAKERQELAERQENLNKSEKTEGALVADFAADCYNHYKLCKLKFDNDSAAYWLERRMKLDSLNMDWRIELADFYCGYIADYDKAYDGFDGVIQNSGADIIHKLEAKYGKIKIMLIEGKYDDALQEALSCREIEDSINSSCRESEFFIGSVYGCLGRYDEAEEYYGMHLSRLLSDNDVDSVRLSNAYNSIGCNYLDNGEYGKAMDYLRKSLELRETLFKSPSLDIATAYSNLAILLGRISEYEKALDYANRALEMRVQILGRDHPSVATLLNNLATLNIDMADYDQAIRLIREAIDIKTRYLGANGKDLATLYSNLGVLYSRKKNYQESLKAYERSLAIKRIYYDENHPDMALTLSNLGTAHSKLENFDEALAYYNKAKDIYKAHFGDNSDKMAQCHFNIGSLYMRQGKYDDAITELGSAREIFESVFGAEHRHVADCDFQLGKIYNQLKDYSNARIRFNNAYTVLLKIHGENHPHVVRAKQAVETMDALLNEK